MATNGIQSSKAPRARRKMDKLSDAAIPHFQGDAILERYGGMRQRLASAGAEPVAGITSATKDDLFRKAGVRVSRGRTL